jgi:hypothetical protein
MLKSAPIWRMACLARYGERGYYGNSSEIISIWFFKVKALNLPHKIKVKR